MRLLEKRSVSLAGHATSVALEPEFWAVLEAQAQALGETMAQRLIAVDAERGERPLASAARVTALLWARRRAGDQLAGAGAAPGAVDEGTTMPRGVR